jgi:hypothetical protein
MSSSACSAVHCRALSTSLSSSSYLHSEDVIALVGQLGHAVSVNPAEALNFEQGSLKLIEILIGCLQITLLCLFSALLDEHLDVF